MTATAACAVTSATTKPKSPTTSGSSTATSTTATTPPPATSAGSFDTNTATSTATVANWVGASRRKHVGTAALGCTVERSSTAHLAKTKTPSGSLRMALTRKKRLLRALLNPHPEERPVHERERHQEERHRQHNRQGCRRATGLQALC